MGSGGSQTIGYKIYLGILFAIGHGVFDRCRAIFADGRLAWSGGSTGGRIVVDAENLFGGKKREGGVSGDVDFLTGSYTQDRNDYLQTHLGDDAPAFRGIACMVLRQCYVGMNPYLKRWSFRCQRIHRRSDDTPQWYDSKSEIGVIFNEPMSVYFAIDISGSMATTTKNGKTRLQNLQTALTAVLSRIQQRIFENGLEKVNIKIQGFGTGGSSVEYRNATYGDFNSIKNWVNSLSPIGTDTDFSMGIEPAPEFFASTPNEGQKLMFFITDGEPWPANTVIDARDIAKTMSHIPIHGVNIDLPNVIYTDMIDNTDGTTVVEGGDPDDLLSIIISGMSGQLDMNPAHILREALTDQSWGMGYLESDIDDESFKMAADTLYREEFGMSLLWSKQTSLDDFIGEITRHINSTLYVDRSSGKFVLKLIRDDYNADEIPILGENNIEKVDGFGRPSFGELVNSVTVNYWDAQTGSTGSITAQDPALVQMQGSVIGTTVQYAGITNASLASRLASRDLATLSSQLLNCTLYADRTAWNLNIGDVFKLDWPDLLAEPVVMRIVEISFGTGAKNQVKIKCTEDAFSLPSVSSIVPQENEWVDPSQPPTAAEYRIVQEAPYYELVQRMGQAAVDSGLSASPDSGYILASAGRPGSAINAMVAVDAGDGYPEEDAPIDFCAVAKLAAPVGKMDTEFALSDILDADMIEPETHAAIGNEEIYIESFTSATGVLVVKRGVLDTIPREHAEGDLIFFWDEYSGGDNKEYVAGEVLGVKIMPTTGQGQLDLAAAPEDSLEMNSRAIRPYPPGNVKINGEYSVEKITGNAEISYASRNRSQQTGGNLIGWYDDAVTPEAGMTIECDVTNNETGDLYSSITGVTESPFIIPSSQMPHDVLLQIYSSRHGYRSMYPVELMFLHGFEVSDTVTGGANLESYSATLTATDASAVFGILSGSLPSGLHLVNNGGGVATISGVPNDTVGYYTAIIRAISAESGSITDTEIEIGIGTVVSLVHFNGENGQATITDETGKVWTRGGNAQISTATSKFGTSSGFFDGSNDYWSTPSVSDLVFGSRDFTIKIWVNPITKTPNEITYRGVVSKKPSAGATQEWGLYTSYGSGNPFYVMKTYNKNAVLGYETEGQWDLLTVSKTSGKIFVGINGKIAESTEVGVMTTSTASLRIGVEGTVSSEFSWHGYMDEFEIILHAATNKKSFIPPTAPSDYPQTAPALAIKGSLPAGVAGSSYISNGDIAVSGTNSPYSVEIVDGNSAFTASVSGNNIVVQGNGVQSGNYLMTLRVTDSASNSVSIAVCVSII